jgi:hypothetical protein
MRTLKIVFILVTTVVVISTSLPIKAAGESPVYAASGPYAVGRAWFRIGAGIDSALILIAWYPAVRSNACRWRGRWSQSPN